MQDTETNVESVRKALLREGSLQPGPNYIFSLPYTHLWPIHQ